MGKYFGTDGIRGIVNEDLTPELAFKVGNVLGKMGEKLIIAQDTRGSGELLVHAISVGAASAGCNVLNCGILPTPAIAILSKIEDCIGVVISASHNPPQYNGIKIMRKGYKLPDDIENDIEKELENKVEYVSYSKIGRIKNYSEAFDIYVNFIVNLYKDTSFAGLRILLDAANGAAYETSPKVLEMLGAKVDVFFNEPDGFNINRNCGSTCPNNIMKYVDNHDFVILHDGDADRCLLVDENKKLVYGDQIIGINALQMKSENRLKNNTVVLTIMSNLGLEKFLVSRGINVIRTRVGDRYILEELLERNAVLGGERSGHVIFLDRSTTGDGLITAIETLRTMIKMNKKLGELKSLMEDYPQEMLNVPLSMNKKIAPMEINRLVKKYQNDDMRVVIRPSGTEPVIRIMVEGKNEELVKETAFSIAKEMR